MLEYGEPQVAIAIVSESASIVLVHRSAALTRSAHGSWTAQACPRPHLRATMLNRSTNQAASRNQHGRARERGTEGDDQRHRPARRRVQGRGLVCAERSARCLGRHEGSHPRDRRRARLVSQPRRTRAVRCPRRRVRAAARPSGEDARAGAVLHGVHRRRRVRALHPVGRIDDPARRERPGRGRRLPPVVGGAPCRRRAGGRPARRRPAGRRPRVDRPARRRRRRPGGRRCPPRRLARRGFCGDRGRALPRRARPRAHRPGRRRGGVRPHRRAGEGLPGGRRRARDLRARR